ncbi:uncharacterized protein LOC100838238 [Brachypodium distachyon]|uniref:uncharacterized protein LOC100838238 n=1 Tax=Brachypodium distachyon TaxID=15368 RepID=UPI0001C755A3|nr:uncharacterized protein LOC100838238 [Brachypodium distachyon]|eukprot:XP_003560089.1 uncharacterized protein LOC100838238 [Brachypodium distachyon]
MDRPDPAEEASHRELMAGLGLYDADWALAKSVELSDVQAGQNRLLLLRQPVRAGSIPRLFPEVEQLDDTGKKNAQNTVRVTLLYAGGVEKEGGLVFLNSNQAYRINGPGWRQFVAESGISRRDRLDLYTCRRGDDGQRCIFVFKS